MKKIIFIFFLCFISNTAYLQEIYGFSHAGDSARINRLESILPALHGIQRIDSLNALCEAHLPYKTDNARIIAMQALSGAEKINYTAGRAEAYINLGRVESDAFTDLPASEKYFSLALPLFGAIANESRIGWTCMALGFSNWVLCKFPKAKEYFITAEGIFRSLKDTDNLIYNYQLWRQAEMEWGHYNEALLHTLRIQDLTGKTDSAGLVQLYSAIGDYETAGQYASAANFNTRMEGWQYNYLTLGDSFIRSREFDSAFKAYEAFFLYAKKSGNGPIGKYYARIGNLFLNIKKTDSALLCLDKAYVMHKKASDLNQVMYVLSLLGRAYNDMKNYEMVHEKVNELLQMAEQTGVRQYVRDAHFMLYGLFRQLNISDSAYAHLQQYTVIKDLVDRDLSAQKLAFYRTESEREHAQSRISRLNEEQKLQREQIKQTAFQRNFLAGGIAVILLAAVTIVRNILLKRKSEKHLLEIAENELQIQKLESRRKIAEREMELLRTQMNPHFVFNSLNSINRFIMENNKSQASVYLTKFSKLVRLIFENSRSGFISLENELTALKLYLELEVVRFEHHFDFTITVAGNLDTAAVKLPPLLFQPYVENAIWHGLMHAKKHGSLLIELYEKDDSLYCEITDNGVGRKIAWELKKNTVNHHQSMGMEITASRIAMLGKDKNTSQIVITDLALPDGSAGGTKVQIKIPACYD